MEYILGIVVSLVVQWLKNIMGTNVLGSYLVVLAVAFIAAASYVLIKDTTLWPVLVQVLTVAGAFYAFILARFETK